jgi:hypothetical protein
MNGARIRQWLRSPWARGVVAACFLLKLALLAVAVFGVVAQG